MLLWGTIKFHLYMLQITYLIYSWSFKLLVFGENVGIHLFWPLLIANLANHPCSFPLVYDSFTFVIVEIWCLSFCTLCDSKETFNTDIYIFIWVELRLVCISAVAPLLLSRLLKKMLKKCLAKLHNSFLFHIIGLA